MEKLIQLFVHLILAVSFILVPYISRRDVSFGIKIPTSAFRNDAIVKIRKLYIVLTVLVAVLLCIVTYFINSEQVYMALIFTSILIYFTVYLICYKKMKALKQEMSWEVSEKSVIDTKFRKRKISISPIWYLLYLLVFLTTVVLVIVRYDSIPEMMRMQVNHLGEVTNRMPKAQGVAILIGTQGIVLLLMLFVQYVIIKAKQEINPMQSDVSIKSNVKFRYVISIFLYLLGLSVGVILVVTTLFTLEIIHDTQLIVWLTLILAFAPVIGLFIMGVKYRQDGTELEKDSDVINKNDDDYWKLGMFYFNKNDPSIFINKRVGLGWTVNHARWQSWVMYALIFGLIIFGIVKGV